MYVTLASGTQPTHDKIELITPAKYKLITFANVVGRMLCIHPRLSVCLFVCLSVCLFVCLFVC